MNFFNSIFSDDPQPSNSPPSPTNHPADTDQENPNPENPEIEDPDSNWSLGSLIKTITTKSESAIGNYRREFEEFGSGLLKETALIRDVASRAVQDLPDSIDAGAAVAQESLESVGQVIDNLGSSVWQGTSRVLELQIFEQEDDDDRYEADSGNERGFSVKKYSWFDSRMKELRGDRRTYSEDPEDLAGYEHWRAGFVLEERGEEIERLMAEERAVERMYLELVPVTVDRERFWSRYLYKADKVTKAEETRARIVRRAVSGDYDEEELSWDVEDDDDVAVAVKDVNAGEVSEVGRVSDASEGKVEGRVSDASEGKVEAEKNGSYDSCKESDLSIVSTQPSLLPGEEELGWDEIEDVESDDGTNKITASGSLSVSDLRKRMSTAEEEEDLRWDIEDDEGPTKS